MLILKSSKIHGVGVFTTAVIRKGAKPPLFPVKDWVLLPLGSLRGPRLRYAVPSVKGWWCPRDPHRMSIGWYLNHSKRPNCSADTPMKALRGIRAGEELTINYDDL